MSGRHGQPGYRHAAAVTTQVDLGTFAQPHVLRPRLHGVLVGLPVAGEGGIFAPVFDKADHIGQRIVQKKGRRYDTPKLISYLVRQGFDYETVRSVVEGSEE